MDIVILGVIVEINHNTCPSVKIPDLHDRSFDVLLRAIFSDVRTQILPQCLLFVIGVVAAALL